MVSQENKINRKFEVLTPIRIESNDTDCYGHLNNSNYARYFEKARKKLIRECLGIDDLGLIERGLGLWIEGSHYEFKIPAEANMIAWIHSYISSITGCRINSMHEMKQEDRILARATIPQFFIDLKTNRPIRLTDERIEDILNTAKIRLQLS